MSHSMTAPQPRRAETHHDAAASPSAPDFRSRFADHKVGFFKLVRSEFIKISSLQSTYWLMGVALLLTVGMAALFAFVPNELATTMGPPTGPEGQPLPADQVAAQNAQLMDEAKKLAQTIPTAGLFFSILVFGAFSVVVIAGEYGTGMIRSTMTAAPKRWPALLAKALVAVMVGGLVALLGMILSYGVGQLILKDELRFALTDGNIPRSVLMGVLYVALIVLMGFGIGLLLRNSAGGVVTIIAILFVLPIVTLIAGRVDWVTDASRFLPSNLGNSMTALSDTTQATREGGPQSLLWNQAALWLGVESILIWLAGLFVAQKRDV